MRIAVTGSSGRVGRVVSRGFEQAGDEVVRLDVQPDADAPSTNVFDLTDYDRVRQTLDGCDAVVHLAAKPWFSENNAAYASGLANNLTILSNILEAGVSVGVRRFVCASSVHAYGVVTSHTLTDGQFSVPDYLPIDEDHPLRPVRAYAVSKAAGELIADGICRRVSDLRVASFRLSHVRHDQMKPDAFPPDAPAWARDLRGRFRSTLGTYTPSVEIARVARLCFERLPVGHLPFNIVSPRASLTWSQAWVEDFYGRPLPLRGNPGPHDALFSSERLARVLQTTIDPDAHV